MFKDRRSYLLAIFTGTMIFLYGKIDFTQDPYRNWDLSVYKSMAVSVPDINQNTPRPYSYRIFGPYLVGLMPVSEENGFYIISVAVALSTVILFYRFLCGIGLSANASTIAAILFCLNKYTFGFFVWNYFHLNDLLSLLFVILLFESLHKSNWPLFGLVLFVGAMTREGAMLMIPVSVIYLLETGQFRHQIRGLLCSILPCVFVFFLIRHSISAPGPGLLEALQIHYSKLKNPEICYRLLINAFIPISIVPLIFFRTTAEFFKTRFYSLFFLLLVYSSSLFGTDNERLLAPAAVIVYWLIGSVIETQDLLKRYVVSTLLSAAFISSIHYRMWRFELISKDMTVALSLLSFFVVSLVFLCVRMRIATKKTNEG